MGQYVTPTTDQSVFVSGQFALEPEEPGELRRPQPPPTEPVAIEILREFGPT